MDTIKDTVFLHSHQADFQIGISGQIAAKALSNQILNITIFLGQNGCLVYIPVLLFEACHTTKPVYKVHGNTSAHAHVLTDKMG